MTICSRRGCSKHLRASNTKGMCASSCESPDAPNGIRRLDAKEAVTVGTAVKRELVEASKELEAANSEVIQRFRAVAEAVGRDPDEMIADFAQAWLDGLRDVLKG